RTYVRSYTHCCATARAFEGFLRSPVLDAHPHVRAGPAHPGEFDSVARAVLGVEDLGVVRLLDCRPHRRFEEVEHPKRLAHPGDGVDAPVVRTVALGVLRQPSEFRKGIGEMVAV